MTDYQKYRLLEMIPATLVWGSLFLAIIFSWFAPVVVIYFILLFDLYWLLRVIYFIFYLLVSWWRYRLALKPDWLAKLSTDIKNWGRFYHIIFLPTYQESLTVVRATFTSLTSVKYPLDKFIVVLAGEERDRANFEQVAASIKEEFGSLFNQLIITVHPANLPGEVASKGANLNYAGRLAQQIIDKRGLNYDDLIVSAFDIDTCTHPQYFSYLTYLYSTTPKPNRASYQPVALYNNNIWESNGILRVTALGTTFWLLTELARPERLFTFSSHSMSWRALVDVGFWQKNIVTEDSRIFLQCFLRYGGDYRVVPLYLPVSMDTAKADGFWQSLKNLYRQQRRWAWGVEHLPFMIWHFRKNKHIPWGKKIKYLWNLAEGMYSWATAPLIIFILGRLPLWLAPQTARHSALYQNTPFTLETLMNLAMAGILASAILSLLLLPPPPQGLARWRYLLMVTQWIFVPITLVIFGSIPAIDAQTRLFLGKYLGFQVSQKKRDA